jgi:hypothetical protein
METFLKQPIADRQFIDAILDDQPVTPNFYDGVKAQKVIDVAIKSYEQGVLVTIDNQ